MGNSRTHNVAKNATVGLMCQVITILASFVHRTYLIKLLGVEYLGINGLFTNVLSILSFAELGIGQAIVFNLYKPISIGDKDKIKSLMKLYKQAYRLIALVVTVFGCILIPFIKYIIKDAPNINENLTLIYCLFLTETVSSYFFTYKTTLISANQEEYKVVVYKQFFEIVRIVIQIIILNITPNFILYLLIQITINIICNFSLSILTNRMYPYIKERSKSLHKEEKSNIFKNVRALIVYKFGSVILNGTDNILISTFVGLSEVGTLSNYTLFQTVIGNLISKVKGGFTASIGNLNATTNTENKYIVFKKIFFLDVWIYGYAAIGLATISNYVLTFWLGTEYAISMPIILASALHFYINSVHFAAYSYRTTLGYFVQGRLSPFFAAIINIVLSIIFAKMWGTAGILLATSFARFFTTGLVDPILIYKNTFQINPLKYYIRYFFYFFVVASIGILCYLINEYINVYGILGIILRCVIVTLVYNFIMFLVFCRTPEFEGLLVNVKSLIIRK